MGAGCGGSAKPKVYEADAKAQDAAPDVKPEAAKPEAAKAGLAVPEGGRDRRPSDVGFQNKVEVHDEVPDLGQSANAALGKSIHTHDEVTEDGLHDGNSLHEIRMKRQPTGTSKALLRGALSAREEDDDEEEEEEEAAPAEAAEAPAET